MTVATALAASAFIVLLFIGGVLLGYFGRRAVRNDPTLQRIDRQIRDFLKTVRYQDGKPRE